VSQLIALKNCYLCNRLW